MTPRTPDSISAESFRIIEEEIGPHSFDADHWPIVRRLIHASGDLEVAALVRFHNDPVVAGLAALAKRVSIVTDVTMVLAGINRQAAQSLGVPLHCFLNAPGIEEEAGARGITRSACGFERAFTELSNAIFVVGNAPTALMALSAAVCEGRAKPALVVAMPVGFVAVTESKHQALGLPVPTVTVVGRKGGSALAAATVNALMLMALEGRQ